MNTVIRHIEYLISRTDCVIIPGIGAVLAHRQCAQFDFDNQSVMPPYRSFSFNSQLTETDGALAYSVARAEGLSFESACDMVKVKTEAMKRQLMLDGHLSLGRIGTLNADTEGGAISFSPFVSDSLSIATAWLPTVEWRPAVQKEEIANVPVRHSSRWIRFAKIAASVAILLGICFVASTPIVVNDVLLASLSPEMQSVSDEELLPVEEEAEVPTLSIAIIEQADCDSLEIDEMTQDDTPALSSDGEYLVIVGSFTTREEAESYVARKYGEGSGVVESNGRYRAYSASYSSESEAREAAAEIGNAWACKR